jgi:hypothetical protein
LLEFASDPEAVDRKALVEEYQRCVLLEDELRTIPMPKKLIPAADALADVAESLAKEAGRIADGHSEDEVLEALSQLDLDAVGTRADEADVLMKDALEYYDVEDTAVYGGGLYI